MFHYQEHVQFDLFEVNLIYFVQCNSSAAENTPEQMPQLLMSE